MKGFEVRKTRKGYAVYNASTNERESGFSRDYSALMIRCARLDRDLAKRAKTRPRACLCCGTTFKSQGAHHRMCDRCRRHRGLDRQMIEAGLVR